MSGIDWSEIETGSQDGASKRKNKMESTSMVNSPVSIPTVANRSLSIPNEALSSVAIGGAKVTGRAAAAAIPVAAVVEIVTTALNIVDHAIQVYGQIRVEEERTKQIQAMAAAQERKAIEQTKQVEVQARERTAAIAIQAELEYESKFLELKRFSIELENEQHRREMSQERWHDGYRIIRESIDSLKCMRDDIWQQMKESNFENDNLKKQFDDISCDINKCLGQLLDLGKMFTVE